MILATLPSYALRVHNCISMHTMPRITRNEHVTVRHTARQCMTGQGKGIPGQIQAYMHMHGRGAEGNTEVVATPAPGRTTVGDQVYLGSIHNHKLMSQRQSRCYRHMGYAYEIPDPASLCTQPKMHYAGALYSLPLTRTHL